MRYPKSLHKNRKIGITGPSGGVQPRFKGRFELAKANFIEKGFLVAEGVALHGEHKHVSAPKDIRAQDFMKMWDDQTIGAIIPPWGGELLIEILPLLDFNKIAETPAKWVMGYSDISSLLFAVTVMTDTSTIHGTNFMDYVSGQSDSLTAHAHDVLMLEAGQSFEQKSSSKFQSKWTDIIAKPERPFQCDTPTKWKCMDGKDTVEMNGRLIGGCLDVIRALIGTPYGNLPKFIQRHQNDGVILYLENCELKPCDVARTLWQMRLAGWFQGIDGIIFGRSTGPEATEPENLTYLEAIQSVLVDLNVTVLLDADIGHQPPQMTLVNGALAHVRYENARATIRQTLA
jgi:muramoyltetrapeptide carboxypeptidase